MSGLGVNNTHHQLRHISLHVGGVQDVRHVAAHHWACLSVARGQPAGGAGSEWLQCWTHHLSQYTVLPHQSAHQHSHSEGSRLHQPWRGLGRPGETTRNPPPPTRKRNVSARSAPAGEWCVAWHLLMVTAVLAVLPIRPTDLGQELADMSLSVTSNKAIICCQSRDDGICPAD